MGIIIVLAIVGFVLGLLLVEGDADGAGIVVLIMLLGAGIGALIASSKPIIIEDSTTTHKVVVVNNYYIYDGNFVTEDNIRGTVQSPDLPVNAISTPPVIERKYLEKKATFWKFGSKTTQYTLKFEQ